MSLSGIGYCETGHMRLLEAWRGWCGGPGDWGHSVRPSLGQICSTVAHEYVLSAAWLRKRLMRLPEPSLLSGGSNADEAVTSLSG